MGVQVLEESTQGYRDSTRLQYRLPPPDRRTDREGEPNLGGHAQSLCAEVWIRLGEEFDSCRVLLQQQLPG